MNNNNNTNNNQIKQNPVTPTPAKVEVKKDMGGVNAKDKKNKIISIIILIVIVLGIFMLTNKKSDAPVVSTVPGCKAGDDFSQTTGEPCFEKFMEPCKEGEEFNKETGEPCSVASTNKNETALRPTLSPNDIPSSYDNALIEYKDKGVLFDMNCVATPAVLEIPLGTRILIANNSTEKTLDFKIPNRTEDLGPLHYMLSSAFNTMGDFSISCNGKDSATVKVK